MSAFAVAVSWSAYVVNLLDEWGINFLPKVLTNAPLQAVNDHITSTGALFNLPAAAIVAAMSVICYIGMRETAGVNIATVSLKVPSNYGQVWVKVALVLGEPQNSDLQMCLLWLPL